jgi:hypothetical protein
MLDMINGELLGDLGSDYRVVPHEKWIDTNLFTEAGGRAAAAFVASGAIQPITFEQILVQEYPDSGRVAFLFSRRISGKWHYAPVVLALAPHVIAELQMAGRWPMVGARN